MKLSERSITTEHFGSNFTLAFQFTFYITIMCMMTTFNVGQANGTSSCRSFGDYSFDFFWPQFLESRKLDDVPTCPMFCFHSLVKLPKDTCHCIVGERCSKTRVKSTILHEDNEGGSVLNYTHVHYVGVMLKTLS